MFARRRAPYQSEFPYERDEEAQVTRREFCNFLFLTSSALFAGAAGFSAKSYYEAKRETAFPRDAYRRCGRAASQVRR